MDASTPTRLAHHLGRLDQPRRRDLVAALFRARGFETTVEGDAVLARGPDGTRRIHVGPAATAPPAADIVVDRTQADPASVDRRVIDDGRLAEMLVYAVDSEETRALCERYLGAPPEDLPAPLSTRVRRRASALGPAVPALLVLGTLFVLVATMAVTLPAVQAPTEPVETQTDAAADAAPTTSTASAGLRAVEIPPPAYPPSRGDLGNVSMIVDVGDGVRDRHAAPRGAPRESSRPNQLRGDTG